jgi:hypothetical protein
VLEETVNEPAISTRAHCPGHPEPRRDIHRECHPDDHFPTFRSNFICLDMLAFDVSLFNYSMMHLLAVFSCPLLPICYCSFIEKKCMNYRLYWASIGE